MPPHPAKTLFLTPPIGLLQEYNEKMSKLAQFLRENGVDRKVAVSVQKQVIERLD